MGILLHCHDSLVHKPQKWKYLLGSIYGSNRSLKFVLERNKWYHITVQIICIKNNNLKLLLLTKGIRTIVFIFIVISITFRPICPPAFFRNYIVYWIHGGRLIPGTSVTNSCIVTHLQPSDDCLLRSLGNQRL